MTINDILPRSGMRALLPAPFPARITPPHTGLRRDPRAGGGRRSGSANFWQHLITGDAYDAQAALPRGALSGRSAGSIGFLERRKFDCAKIFDFVFEFDQCNAKTRCFAKFLDVR
jgi:hypothetical protein